MTMTPSPAAPSNVLFDHIAALPRELRDKIWKQALWSSLVHVKFDPKSKPRYQGRQPALCRVNSWIRREAVPIFYSINAFRISVADARDRKSAQQWLEAIGPQNVGHLRSLRLHGCVHSDGRADQWYGNGRQLIYVRATFDLEQGDFDLHGSRQRIWHQGGTEVSERVMRTAKNAFMGAIGRNAIVGQDTRGLVRLMDHFIHFCRRGPLIHA